MNKNDIIELTIHDLHADGNGVGAFQKNGIAVFVPGGLPGDHLRVKIVKVKKQYAFGKFLEFLDPSPNRLAESDTRICPVAGKCGGCQFQHFEYQAQLEFKEKLVKDALVRIGGFKFGDSLDSPDSLDLAAPLILPIIGMDKPYRYRNKAQFPVGPEGLGFYAPRSHRIIPTTDCNIHMHDEIFREVCSVLEKCKIPNLRHVVIRTGEEAMIIFVLSTSAFPQAEEIKAAFSDKPYTLIVNENTANTNVILGPKFTVIQGSGYIHENIGHIKYRISPRAFFQVNPVQTKVLYDTVASLLNGGERVIDAYSGIGGIALYIAGKVQEVVGIESVPEAVQDAVYNAGLNDIKNARFICGRTEEVLTQEELSQADCLILDPPRKGCDSRFLETVAASGVPKIIYVSCNPATLARDIRQLVSGTNRLVMAQPVDMFPMTGHVETVVLLCRGDTYKSLNLGTL